MNWIEIFRTGTWTSSGGKQVTYRESDLDSLAANFKPESFKPPVTVGHPEKESAAAWGWMTAVKREGDRLLAQFDFVPEFLVLLKKGIYKNRSIGIVGGDTINHVAFLGGIAPAVTGLADIQFSNSPEIDIFSTTIKGVKEMGEVTMTEIEKLQKSIADLEAKLEQGNEESEKQQLIDQIAELKKQMESLAAVEKEKEELKKKLEAVEKEKEELEFSQQKKEVETFCEGLVKEGKLTKAQSDSAAKVMLALTGKPGTLNFAAGETADSLLRKLLEELPVSHRYSNFASSERAGSAGNLKVDKFSGASVDEESFATHERAMVLMKERECDYRTAVKLAIGE